MWTGGIQSFQAPVPCRLAGLSIFASLLIGTLVTGGPQSFQPPRYAVDWWDSVLSAIRGLEDMDGHAYEDRCFVFIYTLVTFNRRFIAHKNV